jgi:Rrf2 family protein
MQLTRESKYALIGLSALASEPTGSVVSLAAIAEANDLPRTFLAKIFQKLARHGILSSERGRGRGYALARPPDSITMREILEAVEGSGMFEQCLLWPERCSDQNPCPLHYRLKELVPRLRSLLEKITLSEYMAESPHVQGDLTVTRGAGAQGDAGEKRSSRGVPRRVS